MIGQPSKINIPTKYLAPDTKINITGSAIASLKESERRLTKFELNDKVFFVLTQSDIDTLENGGFGVRGYGVWVFENEAQEESIVGKMLNISGKEPDMEAKEGYKNVVFGILDIVRAWIDDRYANNEVEEGQDKTEQQIEESDLS